MAEHGILTLSYQSTSYLADRVPELEFPDLPFLFDGLADARAAMDGKLGAWMSRKIEERIPGYRVLGYFENGYRHVSNRLRPVRTPADLKGMRVRLMPGKVHARSFELQGAVPFSLDLKPGLEAIVSGAVDGQENPLANTVDYGAHKVHRYHSLTGHCYLSRGIYMNRAEFERWPKELQDAIPARRPRGRRGAAGTRRGRRGARARDDREGGRRSAGTDPGGARRVRARRQAAARRGAAAVRRRSICALTSGLIEELTRQDAKAAKKTRRKLAADKRRRTRIHSQRQFQPPMDADKIKNKSATDTHR